ncbi:MAG: HAMP domain-containing protein [Caldilineaceae bacterium]|nr:HAMP domain-containing protein [Caldilineaceae bacterium]
MKWYRFNQLWLQFSLAFAGVVIIAAIALMGTFLVLRPTPPEDRPPPNQEQIIAFRTRMAELAARYLLVVVAIGSVVGIAAGVGMSRRMTAPLGALAKGTETIGAGDLTYRVVPQGSEELVALAQSFNQMATQLEAGERLRQNLLADVAHELRTPLTVLQGNLRAILDDVYALDKAEVARLYDQTRHLHRLVNDLHELAQAEARQLPLNLQTTDLVWLLEDAVAIFQPIAEAEEVQLQLELPRSAVMVQVDQARITQVLQNLLVNALRHTPAHGSIRVALMADRQTMPMQASIHIQDTGDGIDPEHLPYLFNRFYRTDGARDRDMGGAGLGLAIVRALVEAHGGQVRAQSVGLGQGSTFTICLPLSAPLLDTTPLIAVTAAFPA